MASEVPESRCSDLSGGTFWPVPELSECELLGRHPTVDTRSAEGSWRLEPQLSCFWKMSDRIWEEEEKLHLATF